MKAPVESIPVSVRVKINPLRPAGLPLFFALAFLPCLLRLATGGFPATVSLAALGPVAAGFWIVASLRDVRFHLALLGPAVSGLLWTANWLMMAGGDCCSTMH